jgi:hypothetical protein
MDATANGEITPNECLVLSRLLNNHVKLLEAADIEKRLQALEKRQ